ncbi:T9SS type A sorting domain-containing protein [Altibacter lentus]|uniref:T9SS type A sorting domain-containing protein n=1 Tax=Altibacter lentus TaxID=1223410 RepID=UPI00068FB938|nr:T9SS type A sorting domain-containing protein [Altibacter lentus]
MKAKNLAVLVFFYTISCLSQPAIEWQKSLGGSVTDFASSIIQSSDAGYIICGRSNSTDGDVTGNHGDYDFWIVKLNASGELGWQRSLGGSDRDIANSIIQTQDSGFIVGGSSISNDGDVTGNHGGTDCWVVKLDSAGVIEWQRTFGGTGNDGVSAIQQTTDGGYIVSAVSDSNDGDVSGNHGSADYWVIKLNNLGIIEWQKSLGGSNYEENHSIKQTSDDGYILAGLSHSNDGDVTGNHGSSDYWIVKLSTGGDVEWQKSFGGSDIDTANSIQQTLDGGYVVVGISQSDDGDVIGNQGGADSWVIKLSDTGDIEWQRSLGGSLFDAGYNIQQTQEGGYMIGGYSNSNDGDVTGNHGNEDYWIVKLNNLGNIVWQKSLGGSNFDSAYTTDQTLDGDFIVAGSSDSNDGDVSGNHGGRDFWIVKLSTNLGNIDEVFNNLITLYPNPNNGLFTLEFLEETNATSFNITDIQGKVVYSENINSSLQILIDHSFKSGLYFINIISDLSKNTIKFIVK